MCTLKTENHFRSTAKIRSLSSLLWRISNKNLSFSSLVRHIWRGMRKIIHCFHQEHNSRFPSSLKFNLWKIIINGNNSFPSKEWKESESRRSTFFAFIFSDLASPRPAFNTTDHQLFNENSISTLNQSNCMGGAGGRARTEGKNNGIKWCGKMNRKFVGHVNSILLIFDWVKFDYDTNIRGDFIR